jgi:kumamolisin
LLYGNPKAFKDITQGNNKNGNGIGYVAGSGWDACTGLGAPVGSKILQLFKGGSSPAAKKPARRKPRK